MHTLRSVQCIFELGNYDISVLSMTGCRFISKWQISLSVVVTLTNAQ